MIGDSMVRRERVGKHLKSPCCTDCYSPSGGASDQVVPEELDQNWEGSLQPAAVPGRHAPVHPLSPWPGQRRAVLCPEGGVVHDLPLEPRLSKTSSRSSGDVRPQPDARLCGCWVNKCNDILLLNNVDNSETYRCMGAFCINTVS